MMKRLGFRRFSVAVLAFLVAGAMALPAHAVPTTNLVFNPSFELSHLPAPVPALLFNQPVWPQGWLAEGVTELFDHTPQAAKGCCYSAGISGSWSGPRTVCEPTCMTVPGGAERDQAYQYYSLAPAWRTQTAFGVTPGTYTFSAWMKLSIPKTNTGARTKVRWLDVNGVPIAGTGGWSLGPSLIATGAGANYTNFVDDADWAPPAPKKFNEQSTTWQNRNVTVTAPAAARFAILLLTYTDDAWIGGVHYDLICFTRWPDSTKTDVCKSAPYAP